MCNYCNICSPRLIEINLIACFKQPSNSVKGSQGQHIEQPEFSQVSRSPTRSITEQNHPNNSYPKVLGSYHIMPKSFLVRVRKGHADVTESTPPG